jgi:ribosomal protein S12 methylthiotransferase accessory factor
MQIDITFGGGKRVDAHVGGFTIRTDQSPAGGGEGSAPEPFTYFLSSIGTCAGIYVLGFCQARGIPTDDIRLTQHIEFDGERHRLSKVQIDVHLPASFPDKYREAVRRAADLCTVKRTMLDPPELLVRTVAAEPQPVAAATAAVASVATSA